MFFSLFFTCYKVDIMWLDEIAEGLKHLTQAINGAILTLLEIRLDADPELNMSQDKLVVYLQNVLR